MQAVINASKAAATGGKIVDASIPTPQISSSQIKYDRLYPPVFTQPATYIRSSSTVEDSIGVPYCMSEEDEAILEQLNAKHQPAPGQPSECTEDWFEQVMNAFEETSVMRQPFSAVDNPPVLSLEEMEASFNDTVEDGARFFAREIYDYWKAERIKRGNRNLVPKLKTLKMDSGQEADDQDAYVCFRRREVRQVRKTRGRDAQVVEKLKRLRRELEEGRHLIDLVKQRELGRGEDLTLSRKMFEQRASVRDMKRTLHIEDKEDELLINQRTKKPPTDLKQPQIAGTPIRIPSRTEVAAGVPESDLPDFRTTLARREKEIANHIETQINAHERWNRSFIDLTEVAIHGLISPEDAFLLPGSLGSLDGSAEFASVKLGVIQQPTPPASEIAESAAEDEGSSISSPTMPQNKVRLASPSEADSFKDAPRFRLRKGRGGRQMIDRHNFKLSQLDNMPERHRKRFKYDHDEGDIEYEPQVDLADTNAFHYRTSWTTRDAALQAAQRRASSSGIRDVPMVNGASSGAT